MKEKKRPELLSPAGNFEKMQAAIRFGADAVYLAAKQFGMRSAADNFSDEELPLAVDYAHARGVKVYQTVNTMPRDAEYPALRRTLLAAQKAGVDALIVSDLGVIALAKELIPQMPLHISTQASIVSTASARAYAALGAERVVLARELSLAEISQIVRDLGDAAQVECFVHGSMCISYSGRCLLSNHFTGRDGNRGQCAQPCRWNYSIVEEKRPGDALGIEENENGTFIMSSRDLCMIEHIGALCRAGIHSFKIEGRMKSAYYTAVITNAYRMALDLYFSGQPFDPAVLREVESVSHREYATGYYFDAPMQKANTVHDMGYLREKAYLATVEAYDPERGTALLRQRNKLCAHTRVERLTPGKCGSLLSLGAFFTEQGEEIPSAPHPNMRFFAEVSAPVLPGDILRGE